ncbi:unannotated protein [freshwater metagenome]|uniref:Unannotated protein n=1 Tax=freshwater metagenome TaxID=449393 RepID=A0A6J6MGN7_9ZZZZ
MSLSLNVVRDGDEAADAIPITPDVEAVTVPTSSDAPDVSEPMMKLTLSDFASFVAASRTTDGASETESSCAIILHEPATPAAVIAA